MIPKVEVTTYGQLLKQLVFLIINHVGNALRNYDEDFPSV